MEDSTSETEWQDLKYDSSPDPLDWWEYKKHFVSLYKVPGNREIEAIFDYRLAGVLTTSLHDEVITLRGEEYRVTSRTSVAGGIKTKVLLSPLY